MKISKAELQELEKEVIAALNKATEVHDLLGIEGEKIIHKNQFGDTAIKADIKTEEAVINHLKLIKKPIRIISEEHGKVEIGKKPIFLGILDGIDGSAIYKQKRGEGRYSTMFGIFQSINPKYGDYLVSGIMEHASKRLFLASRNGGAWVIKNGRKSPVHIRNNYGLNPKTKIYIDNYLEDERKLYRDFIIKRFPNSRNNDSGSSTNYIDIALGDYDVYIEFTKKQNLEKAIAYGFIKEAGGTMVDINGNDMAKKEYLRFGQKNKENIPVITAANKKIAKQIAEIIRKFFNKK